MRLYLVIVGIYILTPLFTLTGCAVGQYGMTATHYTFTNTAVVMEGYSVGLQLRPTKPDFGLTLGYRHSSYVFMREGTQHEPLVSSWYWFRSLWPSGKLILRNSISVGLELQATPELSRIALGYVNQAITVGPSPRDSQVVKVFYSRRKPWLTYIFFQGEEQTDETTKSAN